MVFIKKYPIFSGIVIACILAFIGQVVYIFVSMNSIETAKKDYKKKEVERIKTVALSPAPSVANLELSEKNIEDLEKTLSSIEVSIQKKSSGDIAKGAPKDPSDMFFEIQALIESLRNEAKQLVVEDQKERPKIKLDEKFTFGFGHFMETGKGPEAEHIRPVFIQYRIIAFMLQRLYEAKPDSIVSVLRDPIPLKVEAGTKASANKVPKDTFIVPPLISARIPGVINTYAFKFVFTGYSDTLRNFLTSLNEFEWPLVVRSVEVKSAQPIVAVKPTKPAQNDLSSLFGTPTPAETGKTANNEPVKTPIVDNNLSEYSVIIELIEVAPSEPSKQEPAVK